MNDDLNLFNWPNVQLEHFYAYFVIAAIIGFFLVYKSESKYKIELFFISFYLLTGSYNFLLIFKIPGISFFEIQPLRFVYLTLLVVLIKKTFFGNQRQKTSKTNTIPWFEVALIAYVIFMSISVILNIFPRGVKTILDSIAFIIIVKGLATMADKPSYTVIGKSIIIAAVFSSIISLIQLVDKYFLRIGWDRHAFGDVIRSNGIFSTEYYNGYFLLVAVAWVLVSVKNKTLKVGLVALFSLGVVSTFMRMSWLILAIILLIYLIYIRRTTIEKIILMALSGLTLLLSISIFYYQDIMNSDMVKERLTADVDYRKGYYAMVLDNFGDKPFFGYGDRQNDVYYESMMRITRDRKRAEGTTGGIHNGFLSVMFLYGIPAVISFTLFIILSIVYYSQSLRKDSFFVIPFLVSIIYCVSNFTNSFLFLSYISVLFAIHIGIGMGINNAESQKNSLS